MTPKAPDVRNPATDKPITRAAASNTGLQITNSGVVTASPMTVAVRVRPARMRRVAPKGTRVAITMTCEVEGEGFTFTVCDWVVPVVVIRGCCCCWYR